jgi:hypothetical protein
MIPLPSGKLFGCFLIVRAARDSPAAEPSARHGSWSPSRRVPQTPYTRNARAEGFTRPLGAVQTLLAAGLSLALRQRACLGSRSIGASATKTGKRREELLSRRHSAFPAQSVTNTLSAFLRGTPGTYTSRLPEEFASSFSDSARTVDIVFCGVSEKVAPAPGVARRLILRSRCLLSARSQATCAFEHQFAPRSRLD